MLSGYGIQYSLERHFLDKGTSFLKNLIKFYYIRSIRILPLFWAAYLIECFAFNQKVSFMVLLGVHGTGHYWFVAAIIQCYIIAPIIFVIIRYDRLIALIAILILFLSSNFILNLSITPQLIIKTLKFTHTYWRGIYFLYLLIFALSMFLPKHISSWNTVSSSEKYFYFYMSVLVAMLFMVSSKYHSSLGYLYNFNFVTLSPLILILISSIYVMSNGISIKYISWVGEISYVIYLFHMTMYRSINHTLGFGVDSPIELIAYLICFPFFLYFCHHTNIFMGNMSILLKEMVTNRPTITFS